jgi:hypothetical protein
MDKAQMHRLHGQGENHACAPKAWRDVANLTGDYDLDATIAHRSNPALPDRLSLYVKHSNATSYGARTGYSGYHGYSGDD